MSRGVAIMRSACSHYRLQVRWVLPCRPDTHAPIAERLWQTSIRPAECTIWKMAATVTSASRVKAHWGQAATRRGNIASIPSVTRRPFIVPAVCAHCNNGVLAALCSVSQTLWILPFRTSE